MPQEIRTHHFLTPEDMTLEIANRVEVLAGQAIQKRGCFHLVLAGGTTPAGLYRQLSFRKPDLDHWRFYLGDERCLPPGHTDRNDQMIQEAWPQLQRMAASQFARMPVELGPEQAADSYTRVLGQVTEFDLVLLGMGGDGHTASLFPGRFVGQNPESPSVLPVHQAPKPPPERVSLSAHRLSRAWRVYFLISGESKRPAFTAWLKGADLPVRHIRPHHGVDIFTDLGRFEN